MYRDAQTRKDKLSIPLLSLRLLGRSGAVTRRRPSDGGIWIEPVERIAIARVRLQDLNGQVVKSRLRGFELVVLVAAWPRRRCIVLALEMYRDGEVTER